MTSGHDHYTEMIQADHSDDAAFEALLTSHGARDEPDLLAGLNKDLRRMMTGPAPIPSPQLAAVFSAGVPTADGDLLVLAPREVVEPATQLSEPPRRRRAKTIIGEFLIGLSLAAKAALGVGIAAASVTAAGAAGALPPAAQRAVSAVVSATTPFSFPDGADDPDDPGKTVSTDVRGGAEGKVGSDAGKDQGGSNRPADPGQSGLDQANQTPAAGNAPTSVPSGGPTAADPGSANAGSSGQSGLDRANQTPAAGNVPTSVPSGGPTAADPGSANAGPSGQSGLDRANQTPAAGNDPTSVPSGRSAGRP